MTQSILSFFTALTLLTFSPVIIGQGSDLDFGLHKLSCPQQIEKKIDTYVKNHSEKEKIPYPSIIFMQENERLCWAQGFINHGINDPLMNITLFPSAVEKVSKDTANLYASIALQLENLAPHSSTYLAKTADFLEKNCMPSCNSKEKEIIETLYKASYAKRFPINATSESCITNLEYLDGKIAKNPLQKNAQSWAISQCKKPKYAILQEIKKYDNETPNTWNLKIAIGLIQLLIHIDRDHLGGNPETEKFLILESQLEKKLAALKEGKN